MWTVELEQILMIKNYDFCHEFERQFKIDFDFKDLQAISNLGHVNQ